MICKKPFIKNGTAYGCGQCQPCRIGKRRVWAHRIILESLCHKQNCFLTLTLSDENLSLVSCVKTRTVSATLDFHPLTLFLKRLRTHLEPSIVRFFAVGEYGDKTGRPHFHICLFNYPSCRYGKTRNKPGTNEPDPANCCGPCKLIHQKWGLGNVQLGELNPSTAAYCAEYTLKKLGKKDDKRLFGRLPEATRSSRRPGIGAPAMHEVASSLLHHDLDDLPDVPFALAHGGLKLPLGNFLMKKLRTYTGKEPNAPKATLDYLSEQMRPMREAAFNASSSLAKAVNQDMAQKLLNFEAKTNIWKTRKNL